MDKNKNDIDEEIQNTQDYKHSDQENTLDNFDSKKRENFQSKKYSIPSQQIKSSKTVNEQFSAVATAPIQRKLILLLILIALMVAIYLFLFNFKKRGDNKLLEQNKKTYIAKKDKIIKKSLPVPTPEIQITPQFVPKLPDIPIPVLKEPVPSSTFSSMSTDLPAQGALLPAGKEPDIIKSFNIHNLDSAKQKKLEARRKSSIMVVSGGSANLFTNIEYNKSIKTADRVTDVKEKTDFSGFLGFDNGSFDNSTIKNSSSIKVNATKIRALDRTLLQGKIVHAILETAINTDIPGTLRALVTRDTYAESGKNILIPKGSRLIGSYQSSIANGQTRVNVIWERLIRPDGIDVTIGSSAADQLGRAGMSGDINTKLFEKLTSAFLISYIIPIAASKLDDSVTTTKTSSFTGDITILGNSTANATNQGTQQFTRAAKEALDANFSVQPTITIDQGIRINILVQKDLIFPPFTIFNKNFMSR